VEAVMMSVPDAARALGLGRTMTWQLVRSGQIPSVRVEKRVLLRRVELERWAAKLVCSRRNRPPEGHQGLPAALPGVLRCPASAAQRQRSPTGGCGACQGTGLDGARFCDGCRFIHPVSELRDGRCAVCRQAKEAPKGDKRSRGGRILPGRRNVQDSGV
jgi:excisionase family DNA binding protein